MCVAVQQADAQIECTVHSICWSIDRESACTRVEKKNQDSVYEWVHGTVCVHSIWLKLSNREETECRCLVSTYFALNSTSIRYTGVFKRKYYISIRPLQRKKSVRFLKELCYGTAVTPQLSFTYIKIHVKDQYHNVIIRTIIMCTISWAKEEWFSFYKCGRTRAPFCTIRNQAAAINKKGGNLQLRSSCLHENVSHDV